MIGGILAIGLLVLLLSRVIAPPPPVAEIQASTAGPYNPRQTIILSLAVQARGSVVYEWKNPDGGRFSAATDTSSTRFVVPDEGPVRVVCRVAVDGANYERTFPVQVKPAAVQSNSADVDQVRCCCCTPR